MNDKISLMDFQKLNLKIGKIINVEDHPNADKLFVLKVDLGEDEERTIVAGLRGYYEKEELIGKKAVFVVNLEPVMLRGIESNGMIMAAVSEDRIKVAILTPEKDVAVGTKIS
ncbi:methionine--tRNA ligase subunit beta [Candidatus Pacearchaeota archaeon]|nr:methionine--tRNA ligase subunit beta [Candidatus Pacearchaeota archaeon]